MLYRTLGKTGWQVSVIGFGAWGIGGQWGKVERATATDTVKAAYDAGITFFDMADIYGEPQGLSEELVGEALRPVRDRVIVATKVGYWGSRFEHGLPFTHPSHVELCCDASLGRLKTDVIDLYQCHQAFARRPEVFLEAFENLIKRGKIRAGGISTNAPDVARRFLEGGPCAAVQFDYSYLNRAAERDLLPLVREHGVGAIARGPLAKGVAAGRFTAATRFDDAVRGGWNDGQPRREFLRQLDVVERLRFLDRPGRTMAQAALQFAISDPAVSVAIPGAKTPAQARANAAAGDATLDPAELDRVAAAAPIPPPPARPRGPVALAKRVAGRVLGRR
jgi:aryl-alcohol dehydrogenase-like predicted oxidoreductase